MNVGVEIIGIPINSFRCKLSIVHVWDYNPEADKSALHCDPGPTSPLVSAISLQLLAGPEARHQVTPGPGPGHAWGAGVRPSAQPHRDNVPAVCQLSPTIVTCSLDTLQLLSPRKLQNYCKNLQSPVENKKGIFTSFQCYIILLKYYLMELRTMVHRNYVFH